MIIVYKSAARKLDLHVYAPERSLIKHSPLILSNECSAGLFTKSDENADSDAEYMNKVHRREGYLAFFPSCAVG